jgi:hypothetical protein
VNGCSRSRVARAIVGPRAKRCESDTRSISTRRTLTDSVRRRGMSTTRTLTAGAMARPTMVPLGWPWMSTPTGVAPGAVTALLNSDVSLTWSAAVPVMICLATVAAPGRTARRGRGAVAPGGTDRGAFESASERLARRAPTAKHPPRGRPYGRGGGRLYRRPGSLPGCQGDRPVLRLGPQPRPVGGPESSGADHPQGASGGPAATFWRGRPRSV